MTSSERMTCLVDRDVCNGSVRMYGWMLSWFQCWQAFSSFWSALCEL